jgi:hypothetical protein
MKEVEDRLKNIERDLSWIIQYLMKMHEPISQPPYVLKDKYRVWPTKESLTSGTCSLCGVVWQGTMSYSCNRIDCQMQVRGSFAIKTETSASGQYQTHNQIFDIESLDPDKRSWRYDGHGIRRSRDEYDD